MAAAIEMPAALAGAAGAEPSQAALVERILAGDRAAGRLFYDRHAPRIFRLVYRLVGDAHLAQDVTQDTFVRAFGALRDFRGDASLFTWVHRIALSVVSNTMRGVRRRGLREVTANDAQAMEMLMSEDAVASSSQADPALSRHLAREIEALPEVLRVTLLMHDVEGYTHPEIAAVMEAPEGTCRARLSMARARLREALARFEVIRR